MYETGILLRKGNKMKKSKSVTLLVGVLILIFAGLLAFPGCSIKKSEQVVTDVSESPDSPGLSGSIELVGTVAFGDKAGSLVLTLPGDGFRILDTFNVSGSMTYDGETLYASGTYDDVTGDLDATATGTIGGESATFTLDGNYDAVTGEFIGTITRVIGGVEADGVAALFYTDDISDVTVYLGTFGGLDGLAYGLGTWNLAINGAGKILGTFYHDAGGYGGTMGGTLLGDVVDINVIKSTHPYTYVDHGEAEGTLSGGVIDGTNYTVTDFEGNSASGRWAGLVTAVIQIGTEDVVNDVVVDSDGNVIVVGYIKESLTSTSKDWVIHSYAPDGTLNWSDQMGSQNGELMAAAVDPADDSVYVVGYYEFTVGNKDWLIRKYNKIGPPNVVEWRLGGIGGAGEDIAYDVVVDTAGNVYAVGVIHGAVSGNGDWTIYAFNPDGTDKWSLSLGGKDGVFTAVAVDPVTDAADDDIIIAVGYYTNWVNGTSGKDWLIRMYDQDGVGQSGNPLWATTKIGGSGEDIPYDVAVDSSGNIVIAGVVEGSTDNWSAYSYSRDGITENWSFQMGSKNGVLNGIGIDPADDSVFVVGYYEFVVGNKDWLVRKYTSGGVGIGEWALPAIGGALEDVANAVAVDPSSGAVYIGGYRTNYVGEFSGLDAWVKIFGFSEGEKDFTPFDEGTGDDDVINDVAIDTAGNIYAVGYAQGATENWTTFSFEPDGTKRWPSSIFTSSRDGKFNGVAVDVGGSDPADDMIYGVGYYKNAGGNKDWLIRKYNIDGDIQSAGSWVPFGGTGDDVANDVAVDSAGNVYVVGVRYDTAAASGNEDWAIYSFAPDGTENWSIQGGSKDGVFMAVAVDPVTDAADDDIIITVGYYTNFINGTSGKDWLIRMYDQSGAGLTAHPLWGTKIGGAGEDIPYDVAVDSSGNIVIAGVVEGSTDNWSAYSYSRDGNTLNWSFESGSKNGVLKGIGIDPADDSVFVVGYYEFSAGNKDWLVRKYAAGDGSIIAEWALPAIGGAGEDVANAVAVDPSSGAVYFGGYGTNVADTSSGLDAWLKIFGTFEAEMEVTPFDD